MMTLQDLATRARSLVRDGHRALLGIAGGPGAGKTTLAESLVQLLRQTPPDGRSPEWAAHVPMDGFHLADTELDRLGRRDRKGLRTPSTPPVTRPCSAACARTRTM